ncbi:hypothetical protein BDN72DRAFT_839110 [Pluteus cervinus]|uniref:Uncharacterized protein n=1 Tax=Pluteus cervinus TaxID=181527 RepID=A0ACD3AXQ8_9AGAR|nr:hypothetical protein BDN72DRAFT_839110 [Pluteus cervinus]
MNVDPGTSTPQPYTILRIKRKRGEEPLDALVVESIPSRKRSRGGIGIFKFAQTVETDAWQDEKQKKDIQEQISRLAREPSVTDTKIPNGLSAEPSPPGTVATSPLLRQPKAETQRRYTIVERPPVEPPGPKYPTVPPKVIAAKDLPPAGHPDFRMYDAVPSSDSKPGKGVVDEEMEKFNSMLQDYLSLHETAPALSEESARPKVHADDYVWDVFYHRPATLNEWSDGVKVGTITGPLPSELDPYDTPSDSEEEDEADEDSNAEEYYKNDYPDEASTDSSDEFHEGSEYDDMNGYQDDSDFY